MRYGWCSGILLDAYYRESTCPRRESCQYYDIMFLSVHSRHIDDFVQLQNTPGQPCRNFIRRNEK